MAKPSLHSAYALVDRAGKHINDVKGIYKTLVAAQTEAITIKNVMNKPILPGEFDDVFEVDHPAIHIPEEAKVIIGEAANSLRSALNYLVVRLFELNPNVTKGKQVQFPIEDTKDGFDRNIPRFLKGLPDKYIAAIERIQPYNRCEWTLHLAKLSNLHKHYDLIAIHNHSLMNVTITRAEGNPGEASVNMELDVSFRIALNDGLPIIETLEGIQAGVRHTLDAFKPEFEV